MKPFRRILFATDFSSASQKAFEEAVGLARENGAELLIAHAYLPPALLPTDIYVVPAIYDELDSKLRQDAEQSLGRLVKDARERGVKAEPLLLAGNPYEEISETAKANRADLVVVGTHGRTGVSRFLLGSVASRVIATAPCPVLTVRAA